MKALAPLLLAIAACSPPPPDLTALREEIKALRKESAELQKGVASLRAEVNEATQPKLEALDAWTELTKEVKRLRERIGGPAAAPPAPVVAPALPLPLPAPGKPGEIMGAVGSVTAGISDLFWVLAKVPVENEERIVLSLYQAQSGGRGFKLVGVRLLNYDLQILELGGDRPRVKDIIDEIKKAKPK